MLHRVATRAADLLTGLAARPSQIWQVLLRGYNALLTDADAIFTVPPFAVFPRAASLVVACDSTVVPRDWQQSPGMVMAGFFYARAGVRPIILLKEVLDYQSRHPEQHDQQSFNQILSEILVADLAVSIMHPRLFPNGFQYFVKRTSVREGHTPLVIQVHRPQPSTAFHGLPLPSTGFRCLPQPFPLPSAAFHYLPRPHSRRAEQLDRRSREQAPPLPRGAAVDAGGRTRGPSDLPSDCHTTSSATRTAAPSSCPLSQNCRLQVAP